MVDVFNVACGLSSNNYIFLAPLPFILIVISYAYSKEFSFERSTAKIVDRKFPIMVI